MPRLPPTAAKQLYLLAPQGEWGARWDFAHTVHMPHESSHSIISSESAQQNGLGWAVESGYTTIQHTYR